MNKNEIHLSQGVLPFGIERSAKITSDTGYTSMELIPNRFTSRKINRVFVKDGVDGVRNIQGLSIVESAHHSWRMDNELERKHSFKTSAFQRLLRFTLFPNNREAKETLTHVFQAKENGIPIVVHDIDDEWTHDAYGEEFKGGIVLEMSQHQTRTKEEVKNWLEDNNHYMAIDTRDDQSIDWANKQGFESWEDYWQWIGLEKIKCAHLTFIGEKGLKNILEHNETLAEKQLIWLHKQGWKGFLTVEGNPLTLIKIAAKKISGINNSLEQVRLFVETTLEKGQPWSS